MLFSVYRTLKSKFDGLGFRIYFNFDLIISEIESCVENWLLFFFRMWNGNIGVFGFIRYSFILSFCEICGWRFLVM